MRNYVIAALLAAIPAAAIAGDKMYAWKANVTAAELEGDQIACFKYANDVANGKRVANPYNPVTQSTTAGAMGSAFGAGIAAGIMKAKARNAAYYGCMHDAGYSQRRLPATEYRAFKALKGDARKARLMELASAPTALHPEMPADEYD
ncbi:hypothetical protein [Sphingomonas sp.]|uniref:hypothetical protein n=1 Tax=Sphingomonas sp. TaxID=28214 RepID=UPI0035BC0996